MNIKAFVTTAPRRTNYLPTCLESMRLAGWADPLVLAEPGAEVPGFCNVRINKKSIGPWPNALQGFRMLSSSSTYQRPDAIMLVQDDVVLAKGLRPWLEQQLEWGGAEIAENAGVVSVYCPTIHAQRNQKRWWPLPLVDVPRRCYGACAVVLPIKSVFMLLANPQGEGCRTKADIWLGRHCAANSLDWWYHTPSLAQHIGAVSTLSDNLSEEREAIYRRAEEFVDDVQFLKDSNE